jgi:DNA-binding CsgD family transcriptional regulator/PAS domain-containing protein
MLSDRIRNQVEQLLAQAECAWSQGAWSLAGDLAERAHDLHPENPEAAVYLRAVRAKAGREAHRLTQGLDCLPVLAFLTDRLNRIQWVNRSFAATIGDPVRDRLLPDARFLHAAIAGPYRSSFPRWKQELSNCLVELRREVEAGNLAGGTLRLIEQTLGEEAGLQHAAENPVEWDGTMLVREPDGKLVLVSEHVLSLVDASGHPTGLHLTQWFPAINSHSAVPDPAPSAAELLTSRQLEIARMFASGLNAEQVAIAAGISWRTARDHLEEIYSRMDVHSRAELTLHLARSNLV